MIKGLSQLYKAKVYLLHWIYRVTTEIRSNCLEFATCMTSVPFCYWLYKVWLMLSSNSGIFIISDYRVELQHLSRLCLCSAQPVILPTLLASAFGLMIPAQTVPTCWETLGLTFSASCYIPGNCWKLRAVWAILWHIALWKVKCSRCGGTKK